MDNRKTYWLHVSFYHLHWQCYCLLQEISLYRHLCRFYCEHMNIYVTSQPSASITYCSSVRLLALFQGVGLFQGMPVQHNSALNHAWMLWLRALSPCSLSCGVSKSSVVFLFAPKDTHVDLALREWDSWSTKEAFWNASEFPFMPLFSASIVSFILR